ncbi:MAG: hypothetical protein OEW44_06720 [Gemmatimonadota bacterium]|jgi:hypothetical protein|nr:hypothetical protein [Gemmatimonadota bacterium]
MRRLAPFVALALAAACADGSTFEPSGDPSPHSPSVRGGLVPSAARPNPAQGGWEVHVVASFIGEVDPATIRVASHNLIGTDLVNAFAMTGDLEGTWYFIGSYHVNLKTGRGTSTVHRGLIDITGPGDKVGTFECGGHFTIEDFSVAMVQFGKQFSCTGTGYFEGKKFKAYLTNEANPGINVYQGVGVIY